MMSQLKKMTVNELLNLLISLTRENEIRAKDYYKSNSVLIESSPSINASKEKIQKMNGMIKDLILENKKFIQLFKDLMEFNDFFNENVEIVDSEDKQMVENTDNFEIEHVNSNEKLKTPDELNELMNQYIAEEKYEECIKIKALLEHVV